MNPDMLYLNDVQFTHKRVLIIQTFYNLLVFYETFRRYGNKNIIFKNCIQTQQSRYHNYSKHSPTSSA